MKKTIRRELGSPQDSTDARTAPAVAPDATKCPTCDSPRPHLHPAVQFEGEVQVCADAFHRQPTPENIRCPYCGFGGCVCGHEWGDSCRCAADWNNRA